MPVDFAILEDLREEFCSLACSTLAEEVRELGRSLRCDVQCELRRWLTIPNDGEQKLAFDEEQSFRQPPHFVKEALHSMAPPEPPLPSSLPEVDELSPMYDSNESSKLVTLAKVSQPVEEIYVGSTRGRLSDCSQMTSVPCDGWSRGAGNVYESQQEDGVENMVEAWSPRKKAMVLVHTRSFADDSPGSQPSNKTLGPYELAVLKNRGRTRRSGDSNSLRQAASSPKSSYTTARQDSDTLSTTNEKLILQRHKRRWRLSRANRTTVRSSGLWASFHLYQEGEVFLSEAFFKFVRSEYFDYFMGLFLVANAVLMGAQVNHMSGRASDVVPTSYRVIDGTFCMVFIVELGLRVLASGRSFLTQADWKWNVFDIVIVVFQAIDEFSKLMLSESDLQDFLDGLGVLRMLRLARILRLIRMVRLLPELRAMVYLIFASMRAFLWTAALLMMLIYIMAVYYTEVATDIIRESEGVGQSADEVEKSFGSVGNSIFSLFQAISGGDDWKNFTNSLGTTNASTVTNSLVFSLYVAFATLVMLNLVTGVFVEGAQRLIQEEKDSELNKQVRKLFHIADSDDKGEITFEEFQEELRTGKRLKDFLKRIDLQHTEAECLFKLMDQDRSGQLDVHEFVKGMRRLKGPARSVDLNALQYRVDELVEVWGPDVHAIGKKIVSILDKVCSIEKHLAPPPPPPP